MRIAIYPRKSVYRDNSDSVQVQIKMCKDYANLVFSGQELEFFIYDKDEGFSGKNTNRPSFQALMSDVKNKQLDVVIVYKLDRISRNVQEFSAMYDILQQYNVAFVSVKESFDTSTPIGRTVMYILAAFAQLERENTSERVSDSMHSLGASGKWTGGKLPSGMTSIRKQMVGKEHSYLMVDENTISRVKMFYELLLGGYTITKIERYCRDNDITSQTGKFLNTSQLYNILTNPVYCQNSKEAYNYFEELGCSLPNEALFDGNKGLIGYGKTKTGRTNQPRQDKSKWTIAIGIHEPVISSQEWIDAQKRLGVNKQVRSNKYEVGILKGVLKCTCGSSMGNRVYVKNNIMFGYYYCQDAIRKGDTYCTTPFYKIKEVDEVFINELKRILFNPQELIIAESKEVVIDTSSIKADIRKTDIAIENLTRNLQENLDSPATKYIINQIEQQDKSRNGLVLKLKQAQSATSERKSKDEQAKLLYDGIVYFLDNFDVFSYKEKNEIIKRIVSKCVLDEDKLEVIF